MFLFQFPSIYIKFIYYQHNLIIVSFCLINTLTSRFRNSIPTSSKTYSPICISCPQLKLYPNYNLSGLTLIHWHQYHRIRASFRFPWLPLMGGHNASQMPLVTCNDFIVFPFLFNPACLLALTSQTSNPSFPLAWFIIMDRNHILLLPCPWSK